MFSNIITFVEMILNVFASTTKITYVFVNMIIIVLIVFNMTLKSIIVVNVFPMENVLEMTITSSVFVHDVIKVIDVNSIWKHLVLLLILFLLTNRKS